MSDPETDCSDAEFAEEIVQRMADQHEATVGDEGVVYVGDDDDFGRFLRGLVELDARPDDPVVAAFEPQSGNELAAALMDSPRNRVVRIDRDHGAPCFVWYDGARDQFRCAVYLPDDERETTPELGDTGKLNPSVWSSYFDRAVDGDSDCDYELLEPQSLPPLVKSHLDGDMRE